MGSQSILLTICGVKNRRFKEFTSFLVLWATKLVIQKNANKQVCFLAHVFLQPTAQFQNGENYRLNNFDNYFLLDS